MAQPQRVIIHGTPGVWLLSPLNIASMPNVDINSMPDVNLAADTYTGTVDITGTRQRMTPFGDVRSADRALLLSDHFQGVVLDGGVALSNVQRWVTQTLFGAGITVNGVLTLDNGAHALGRSSIDSQRRVSALSTCNLMARAALRFVDAGGANNFREFGLRDDPETTKVYFQLDNATLNCRVDKAGVNQYNLDTTLGVLANQEFDAAIEWSREGAFFYINGEEVANADLAGRTSVLTSNDVFRVYVRTLNNGAAAADFRLECGEIGCYLVGDVRKAISRLIPWSQLSDGQIVYGAGFLEGIHVLANASAQSFRLEDNIGAGGSRYIWQGGTPATGTYWPFPSPIYFSDGIYFNSLGGEGAGSFQLLVRS